MLTMIRVTMMKFVMKAMTAPLGDQRGELSPFSPFVILIGFEPSLLIRQMWRMRSFFPQSSSESV